MRRKSWIYLLVVLTFGLFAFSKSLQAQIIPENPDQQSREEIEAARQQIQSEFKNVVDPRLLNAKEIHEIMEKYGFLDPDAEVPPDLLQTAVIYLDKNRDKFPNQNYITIVDFKPRSDHYRFFLINMVTGEVEKYHTTHGSGSDVNADGIAERFSNVVDSRMSSIGFIRTAEIYSGAYKRSIRLDGLSSTNSNIRERAIVLHGWDDVHESNIIQGLSAGCITLDWALKDAVIDKVRGGSLIYVGVATTTITPQ